MNNDTLKVSQRVVVRSSVRRQSFGLHADTGVDTNRLGVHVTV